MTILSKGKCYFAGTTEDIENLSYQFRTKMLTHYEKHWKNKTVSGNRIMDKLVGNTFDALVILHTSYNGTV